MKRVLLLLVVLIAAGLAWLLLSLDARVARSIETSASRALGVPVGVDGVDLDLAAGRGTVHGLRVANPEGFSDEAAVRLDEIDLAVQAASLGQQPFRVTHVRIGTSTVRFEVTDQGASNIEGFVERLREPAEDDDAGDEAQRIAIETLRFDGGEIQLWREGRDEPERVTLPPLEMHEVGGEDGATGGELGREIGKAFMRRVVAATAGHEFGRAVEKELGGAAGDVVEGLLRRILE